MQDIMSKTDLEVLIDHFYKKAMKDSTIGHFFAAETGFNLEKHRPTIVSFWDSLLFGTQSYHGNPMEKHIVLNRKIPFEDFHFKQWLLIWEKTVNELFNGKNADEIIKRARNIAALMLHQIKQSEIKKG